MSLYDHIGPSERAHDLALAVKRLRKHTGLRVVPMLVVEGPTDSSLFSGLCHHGERQVFAAGTRGLVEQLLVYLESDPLDDCRCVFLTDCDGRGKAPSLESNADLVVTHACDLESDLVSLGVVARAISEFVDTEGRAEAIVNQAVAATAALATVRRAAAAKRVSMKRRQQQFRIWQLEDGTAEAWVAAPPDVPTVIGQVAGVLNWSDSALRDVQAVAAAVPSAFDRSGYGKDVLDVAFDILRREGRGEVRGWNLDHFHLMARRALTFDDLPRWEVGRRIRSWESRTGLDLVL